MNFLERYQGFRDFRELTPREPEPQPPTPGVPEEDLDAAYRRAREALTHELLDKVRASPPSFFEQMVVDLLLKMGYGGSREDAGRRLG